MKLKALIAEFVGTFAVLFVGVGTVMACETVVLPKEVAAITITLFVALGHGLIIAVCGSALGHVSGGHFNPAISLAMAVAKKLDFMSLVGYWIAQVAGAVVGVFLIQWTTKPDFFESKQGAIPTLYPGIDPIHGFVLEAVAVFFVVLVVLGTAVDRKAVKTGALYIGLTFTVMMMTISPLTGGSINPARWLGPAIVRVFFDNAWIYILGPMAGALVAALLYVKILSPEGMQELPAEA